MLLSRVRLTRENAKAVTDYTHEFEPPLSFNDGLNYLLETAIGRRKALAKYGKKQSQKARK